MSIEEIINRLDYLMRKEHAKNAMLPDGFPLEQEVLENEKTLCEAIALLKTHPDAQPNEPLTLEELRGMVGKPVWVGIPGVSREISCRWIIVAGVDDEEKTLYAVGGFTCYRYGNVWLAYRRPPKED